MSDLDLIYGTKPKPTPPPAEKSAPADIPIRKQVSKKASTKDSKHAITQARKQESLQASNHASMITLSLPPEILESIRKVVKNPGKAEVLYVRVSKEEKDALDDVSYTYKRQDIKTSDNEIVRVAVNVLLEDYKANRANSLLAMMIASLHA
jgi:hypothetical protein